MTKELEITTELINDAMATFCPFGYLDIKRALQVIAEAEGEDYVNTEKLHEIVSEDAEAYGFSIEKLDPVACVYDHYHQEARTTIEQLTNKDICNDSPYDSIYVYGNYMATSFDGNDGAFEALKKLIETIPEEDRTSAINWLYSEL